jgi:hypothetical protein
MAISHQIVVEKHQGILKCRSQPGEGTEFWIQIPVNFGVQDHTERLPVSAVEGSRSQAIEAENGTAISPSESSPIADAEGFIPSTTPSLKPAELLIRHTQLLRRLSQQNPEVGTASPAQIYYMFQRHPISLKLYATLLSWFCCPNSSN